MTVVLLDAGTHNIYFDVLLAVKKYKASKLYFDVLLAVEKYKASKYPRATVPIITYCENIDAHNVLLIIYRAIAVSCTVQ